MTLSEFFSFLKEIDSKKSDTFPSNPIENDLHMDLKNKIWNFVDGKWIETTMQELGPKYVDPLPEETS